jgi:hypothetical protein
MDRLLVLRLEATPGCSAEAVLNGIPVARVGGTQPLASVAVHEYTLAGANELALVVGTPGAEPEPMLADGRTGASLRLLLPRVGASAHPQNARTLAQIDWMPAADSVHELPHTERAAVDLPIAFPRWRWLDAPVIAEPQALKKDIAAFLLEIALGLARGNPEPLIQATRLRLEDVAQAYQRNLADEVGRLRVHIQQLHAAQPLKPVLPSAAKLVLRPVAGGRLLECLAADGGPVLRSPAAGGVQMTWPLRLAAVDGRFYALR